MKSGSLVLAAILLFGLLVPNVSAGAVTVKNGLLNATGNLYAGFDGLFVDSVLGRVGIGTLNPQARLDVNGSSLFNGIMNLSNNRIIGLAAPIEASDAATKEYVDAASSGSLGNVTLNVNMPLQGVLNYDALASGGTYYRNTIPISLPKTDCGVKITACFSPPAKMVVGADPVSRVTKTPINAGPGGVAISYTDYSAEYGRPTQPGPYCGSIYGDQNYHGLWCTSASLWCASLSYCCPTSYPNYTITDPLYCYACNSTYANIDPVNHICYNNPRCSAASAGQTYIQYNINENTCIYCASDHPVYDPTSKNCIKNTTITTNSIGGVCSTINTYLPTAFTDVTFLNASDMPVGSTLISVAYNCPSD